MTSNPDFKGMPLSDIECLRNDTKQTHGHYKPLTESDMWPTELYQLITNDLDRQGHFSYFSLKITLA